jgi:pimeloyl-ACP methyl ester carboxylesterase
VIEEKTSFYSEGLKLDASFYLPDAGKADTRRPLVLTCSGFMGLNRIHPARFARSLTALGYTCFGFDYRGFAESEGELRRVLLEEQITDIANAAAYASTHPNVYGNRVLLMGWGMGGGLVLEAARLIPKVVGLVCMNGFYNGKRVQKMVRGFSAYVDFLEHVDAARALAVRTGEVVDVDPFTIYPLDPQSEDYVDTVLRQVPEFGGLVKPMLADSLLRFAPDTHLEDFSRVPLLIAHGERNFLHPPTEAEELYTRYPGPKQLHWLWNAGHTEWMADDNPTFQGLVSAIDGWYHTHVATFTW